MIDLNDLRGCSYFEPYAGGAGAALRLLREGVVADIELNDADRRVFAFWHSVLNDTERFVREVETAPLTIEEWRKQHGICRAPEGRTSFEVGFAAFYMNRCNRSGILTDSGPIGGFEQSGRWRLDVRFNRETLAARILEIARHRESISVYNEDAIAFLKQQLPSGRARKNVFAFLDPPYVRKGQRLYLNAYTEADHRGLARYLLRQKSLRWVVSYDKDELVQRLYGSRVEGLMDVWYSLQTKRFAQEIIVAAEHMTLPLECRGSDRRQVTALKSAA